MKREQNMPVGRIAINIAIDFFQPDGAMVIPGNGDPVDITGQAHTPCAEGAGGCGDPDDITGNGKSDGTLGQELAPTSTLNCPEGTGGCGDPDDTTGGGKSGTLDQEIPPEG